MKKVYLSLLAIIGIATASQAASPVKTITGNITGNAHWSYDTIYLLSGKVYVKAGASLTIEPGTLVKGDYSTPGSALVITRGAQIHAVGEPKRPIVFTSSQAVGSRATADWGGIILEGNARVNPLGGVGTVEGGNLSNPDGTVSDGQYGGLNDLDNSGEMKYVRIEYAGYPYAPNNELNGLTLGGVGSGTQLSHIQVSYGFDDSFEWFGGTVNADHLISYRGNDDDFDTDFGFRGHVQFGVAMRDTAVADAVSGSNGFESDNDATGTANSPFTQAVFSNMTMVGPKFTPTTTISPNFKRGAHIRRNSQESVFNSIIMGWPTGVKVEGDSCHRNADSSWLQFQNNVIAACPLLLDSSVATNVWNITPWFTAATNGNTIYNANTDVMLSNPFNYAAPDFRPSTGSPVLTGASFSNPKLATGFDNTVSYKGAFGADNWMQDWANFSPDTNAYTDGIAPLIFAGVTNLNNSLQATIFPNPSKEYATILFNLTESTQVVCSIVDINGKEIANYSQKMNVGKNHFSIQTSQIANGLYFVKVTTNTSSTTLKLNINH